MVMLNLMDKTIVDFEIKKVSITAAGDRAVCNIHERDPLQKDTESTPSMRATRDLQCNDIYPAHI